MVAGRHINMPGDALVDGLVRKGHISRLLKNGFHWFEEAGLS